jgi:hypothetical protein
MYDGGKWSATRRSASRSRSTSSCCSSDLRGSFRSSLETMAGTVLRRTVRAILRVREWSARLNDNVSKQAFLSKHVGEDSACRSSAGKPCNRCLGAVFHSDILVDAVPSCAEQYSARLAAGIDVPLFTRYTREAERVKACRGRRPASPDRLPSPD